MADIAAMVKHTLAIIGMVFVYLRYRNDFSTRKKYRDEYTISKDILRNNRWKDANDVELQLWYRAFTKKTIDARTIRYMLNFENPLPILQSYANGINYIKEQKTEKNQLKLSFKEDWIMSWKKDCQWQINFYTLLYFIFCSFGVLMFLLIQHGSSTLPENLAFLLASGVSFTIAFMYPLRRVWDLRDAKTVLDRFSEQTLNNSATEE